MPRRSRQLYRFGQFEFTSKNSARQFFGAVREAVGDWETITDPAHALAVAELFRGHQEYAQKAKCGVKRFFVAPAPDHPNSRCFWIEREDGSTTDFGVAACLQSVGGLNRQSFRELVRDQVYAFREQRLAQCEHLFVSDYSGLEFGIAEAHVDHVTEFEEIATQFARAEDIDLENELLTTACDAKSQPQWKDESLATRFLEHHLRFPLRIVSKRENLSDLRLNRKDERSGGRASLRGSSIDNP